MQNLHRYVLTFCLLVGVWVRVYRLPELMMFIGDQGWFYQSARQALLTGDFPLLGITSSVTWLHQGPLYTYFLIPELLISNFHPVAPAYLTVFISALTIILLYWVGRIFSTPRTGLILAFLYSISPLAVVHARMPYHTSLIPFFLSSTILLLHRRRYFLTFLFLGFLLQLELASIIFWPAVFWILLSHKYSPNIKDASGLLLGLLPFLVSGPIATFGVFIWTVSRLFVPHGSAFSQLPFYSQLVSRLYFPALPQVSLLLLFASLLSAFLKPRLYLVWMWFPVIALLLNSTPSEAYFTLLFIPLLIILAFFLNHLQQYLLFLSLTLLAIFNLQHLTTHSYYLNTVSYGPPLSAQLQVSRFILEHSITAFPKLQISGPGSHFPSTKDSYSYLIWWLSRSYPPSGRSLRFNIDYTVPKATVLE